MSQTQLPQTISTRARRSNNRAVVRYRCAPATIGRLYIGEDHEFQHAWVLNLSRQGIGFLLTRPVRADAALVIQLRGTEDNSMHELTAHLVHCTEQHDGDFFCGCTFDEPLSPDLLDRLL